MDDNLTTTLVEEIAAGRVNIKDSVLTFPQKGFPKIEKLILDEGYEDPVKVQFSPTSPTMEFPIDIFSKQQGTLGEFLRGLLDGNFKIEERELAGALLYVIRIDDYSFSSVYRKGLVAQLIPTMLVRVLGHSKEG